MSVFLVNKIFATTLKRLFTKPWVSTTPVHSFIGGLWVSLMEPEWDLESCLSSAGNMTIVNSLIRAFEEMNMHDVSLELFLKEKEREFNFCLWLG